MAVVGDAYIVVRAITNRVKPEIEKAFSGLDRTARITGERTGREFDEGVKKNIKNPLFSKKFLDEADKARKRFQSLVQVGYFLGPLITSLIGGIGSLAAGLVVLSTALSRAAPAGIVLVSSLAALAQAAITLKLAFKGVFEAVGAKETSRGANNARAIEKALDRLLEKRAELEAFEASIFEKNLERRRQLVDVEDRYADAIIGLERQQRAFIKVQQANIDAQQAVTKAREDAREAIQQLRFELEGGAISEKKARLAFEKARESLQRVQDLPPNSRARQEAELAFAEAELNLRKAIDRNKDLQKEEAESTRRGVEGSEAVVNAKQRAVDANQAEADAIVDLAQAQRDFEKTTQDTIRSRQALSQENFDKQIAADRAKLEKEIDDAEKDLEDLKKKSGGGPSALQQALKDLSPEARKFVEFLRGPMKDSLKDLRAEAGAELFPKLETALTNIKDNLFKPLEPLVRRTGGVLGDVAVELSNVVTEGENIERLERIWGSGDKLIGNFGAALGNVYELLLILLDAARPLAEEFGQWIEDLTGGWASDADKNFETIQTRFEEAGEIVKTFAEIFGNLFDGFASIGDAVTTEGGGLDILLGYFVESSENFAKLMDQMEGDGSLAKYFADATTNATKILSLLGAIVGAFFKLGDDEGIGIFADKLSEAVGIFAGAGEGLTGALPALGDLIIAFAELTAVFTDTGALTTFFEILTTALNVVVDIAGSDLAKAVFPVLATVFAISRAIGLIGKIGGFAFKVLVGNFVNVGRIGKGIFGKEGVFKKTGPEAIGKLKESFRTFGQNAKSAWETARLRGMYAWDGIKKGGRNAVDGAKRAARGIGRGMSGAVGAVKNAMSNITKALMANPWILIVLALIIIVTLVIKYWDEIKAFVGAALDWIGEKVSAIWNWIVELTTSVFGAVVDFFKELPGKLLDAIKALATTVWEFIKQWHPLAVIIRLIAENWDGIMTFFKELPGKIVDFIGGLASKVLDFIEKYHPLAILWRFIKSNWDEIKGWFQKLPGRVKDAIISLSTTVKRFIDDNNPIRLLWNKAKELWNTVFSWFKDRFTDLLNYFKELPGRFARGVGNIFGFLKEQFQNIINSMILAWNNFALDLRVPSNAVTEFLGLAGKGVTINTPDIPLINLATGGVVSASPGGTIARIAEAGRPERVEPLDKDGLSKRDRELIKALSGNGTGGATINVYPSAGMNERDLAQKVSRELAMMMRRGAA